MRRRALRSVVAAGGLALASAAHPSWGAAECQLTVVPLDFGPVAAFVGSAPVDGTGQVEFRCVDDGLPPTATDVSYTVSLDPGTGGSFTARAMSGTTPLEYNLFVDPSRTAVWGDGSAGTQAPSGTFPVGSGATLPVYGRIFGSQAGVEPGLYADSVTVTVEY